MQVGRDAERAAELVVLAAVRRLAVAPHLQTDLQCLLERFVRYVITKRAIAEELVQGSEFYPSCRSAIDTAGEPMLRRAQEAGAARADVSFDDVLRPVGGITMFKDAAPGQIERVLGMALDGIRVR